MANCNQYTLIEQSVHQTELQTRILSVFYMHLNKQEFMLQPSTWTEV